MIDGSAVYSTPLAAMPGDVVWPPAYAPRFTFDVASSALIGHGALTQPECRALEEYLEKAEGQFTFANCHGTLQLSESGWTVSHVTGYGVNPWNVQPLGSGYVE